MSVKLNNYHHKSDLACGDKGRNEKLIKLVETLEVCRVASPFMFVYEIQRCVCNKLIQMSMIFFLLEKKQLISRVSQSIWSTNLNFLWIQELLFEYGIVIVTNNSKIITAAHFYAKYFLFELMKVKNQNYLSAFKFYQYLHFRLRLASSLHFKF